MSDLPMVLDRPTPVVGAEDLTSRVRRVVAGDLAIESIEMPLESEQGGVLVLRGRLQRPSHEVFPQWLAQLRTMGYTPMLRPIPDGAADEVALLIHAGVPRKTTPRVWINALLFALTILSTLFVGLLYSGNLDGVGRFSDLLELPVLLRGWPFSATILAILTAHEFGHYFAARYHKVTVSLPYFIPFPTILGTMGAVIVQREPISDRRKMFDIGVAGPLAGLVLAIPLLILGLATSEVNSLPPIPDLQLEGNSILYYLAKIAVLGQPLPNFVTGIDVYLNQVAFAAWAGLYVTFLNLLPVGQLDGGHTVYALFGRGARVINLVTIVVMGLLALAGTPFIQELFPALRAIGFLGWFIWLGLIIFLLTPFHPPALDDVTKLDTRRRMIGYFVIVCFILTAVPAPFYFIN